MIFDVLSIGDQEDNRSVDQVKVGKIRQKLVVDAGCDMRCAALSWP